MTTHPHLRLSTMNLQILPDIDELAERAAGLFARSLRDAVADRGRFLVALSGGTTPRPVYERLAREPYGDVLGWKGTSIYFGDERMVPCDSSESNYRMACVALLDRVDIPPWNVHRIEGEIVVAEAAQRYDDDLRRLAADQQCPVPRFDLILLGLGPDGHTASLFPGTDALENVEDRAAPVSLPDSSQGLEHARDRVTMTYPVINAARHVVFLVAGNDKGAALARVQEGDGSAPAARVRPIDGDLTWLVVRTA